MSELNDKIKSDPVYAKAFDKGVTAGVIFGTVVTMLIIGLIKLIF